MQAIYKNFVFCILESKQALNIAAVVNGIAKFFFPYAEVMIATTEAFIRVLSWQNKSSFYGPVRFSFPGLFRLVLAYFFSHGTIKSAEISGLLNQPNMHLNLFLLSILLQLLCWRDSISLHQICCINRPFKRQNHSSPYRTSHLITAICSR